MVPPDEKAGRRLLQPTRTRSARRSSSSRDEDAVTRRSLSVPRAGQTLLKATCCFPLLLFFHFSVGSDAQWELCTDVRLSAPLSVSAKTFKTLPIN